MKELTIFEKIKDWIQDIPQFWCEHKDLTLSCLSSELVNGYCSYHAMCQKCHKGFRIEIHENNKAMNASYD